jgi:hypothetical protein
MMKVTGATGMRVVAFALLLLFAAAAGALAQRPSEPGANAIGVNGRWLIEVRAKDGTPVARHEFDNALVSAESLLLALSRQNTPGYWAVLVYDFYGVGSPCGGTSPCALQEPGHTTVFSGTTKLVVLSVALEGSPVPDKLVLQGTFTATATGQISEVVSTLTNCANTVAPATPCASSLGNTLTLHRMQSSGAPPVGPIPIAAGQIVQVRVELTFSATP